MAISSTSGISAAWGQFQVEQARQFAERAAATARNLQSKASAAQSEASRAVEYARSVNSQASQAQDVASRAADNVRASASSSQTGARILKVVQQTLPTQQATPAPSQPTINTQGETIGTVLNVAA